MIDKEIKNSIKNLKDQLSAGEDLGTLMEQIMADAKKMTNSDAATIYCLNKHRSALEFTAVQTDSLFLSLSRSDGNIPWPDLQLYDDGGNANHINASVISLIEDKIFNVPDVYDYKGFDFEGPKAFDKYTGYETRSMLILPVKGNNSNIGVLQLINKKDGDNNTVPFTKEDEETLTSILSQ